MKNKSTILCAVAVFLSAILSLYFLGNNEAISITINGEEIDNPLLKGMGGIFGFLVGVIALTLAFLVTCLAVSGVGLVIFGVFVLILLILLAMTAPFSLPVVIPLLIVTLLFIKANRRNQSPQTIK